MSCELTLRPQVGMRHMVAVPYVVALGVCDALPEAAIAWPHDVIRKDTGELLTHVESRGGYDEQGMFVRMSLDVAPEVQETVEARVAAWAHQTSVAPLAAVLGDYADKLIQLGTIVQVVYPNGRPYARGTFVGVDIWGRATVRLESGKDLEFPPEKFRIV